jgi:hypothetical protein
MKRALAALLVCVACVTLLTAICFESFTLPDVRLSTFSAIETWAVGVFGTVAGAAGSSSDIAATLDSYEQWNNPAVLAALGAASSDPEAGLRTRLLIANSALAGICCALAAGAYLCIRKL